MATGTATPNYSRLRNLPVFDARNYGVATDGTDSLAGISAAIAAANAAGRGVVSLPRGTVTVAPSGTGTFIEAKSNVNLQGNSTVLRVKDNAGNFKAVISQNAAVRVDNFTVEGITFDMNPTGNFIGTTVVGITGTEQYAIYLNNTSEPVVHKNRFSPCTGVNTVVLTGNAAQVTRNYFNFAPRAPIAIAALSAAGTTVTMQTAVAHGWQTGAKIMVFGSTPAEYNGYFTATVVNSTTVTYTALSAPGAATVLGTTRADWDNSAVYLLGPNYTVSGNIFETAIGSGARSAVELHRGGGSMTGNIVDSFQTMCNIVGDDVTVTSNSHNVSGNTGRRLNWGLSLWPVTGKALRNVVSSNNTLEIAQTQHYPYLLSASKYGHGIAIVWDAATSTGLTEGWTCEGNTIMFEDEGAGNTNNPEYLSAGIRLMGQGITSGVVCSGNTIIRAPGPGIRVVGTVAGSAIKTARVTNNIIIDAGQNQGIVIGTGAYRAGITLEGTASDVTIEHNTIVDTGAVSLKGKHAINNLGATAFSNIVVRNNRVSTASGITLPLTNLSVANVSTGDGSSSTDRGDASVTLVAGVDAEVQRFDTALTANRTVTLSSTNRYNGCKFRIVRTGLGAFTLNVGGLKTIPSATAAFVDVVADNSAWKLTGYGTL